MWRLRLVQRLLEVNILRTKHNILMQQGQLQKPIKRTCNSHFKCENGLVSVFRRALLAGNARNRYLFYFGSLRRDY